MGDYKKGKRIVYIIALVFFIVTMISNYFLQLDIVKDGSTESVLTFAFQGFTKRTIINTFISLFICYFLCIGNNIVKNILTMLLIISSFFILLELLGRIEIGIFKSGDCFALLQFFIYVIIILKLTKNKDVKCFFDKNKKRTDGTYKM